MRTLSHLFFILSLTYAPVALAKASNFSGCKGQKIGKTDGGVTDVSNELSNAEKRIKTLCEKEFPPKLQSLQKRSTACASGASPGNMKRSDNLSVELYSLEKNIKDSCKELLDSLKSAAKYCSERAKSQKALNSKIQNMVNGSTDGAKGREEREVAQQEAFKKQYEMYDEAKVSSAQLSTSSAQESLKIYRKLPGFEEGSEKKGAVGCFVGSYESASDLRNRKEGYETKDTKDPKLDEIVDSLQRSYKALANGNSNAKACESIASSKGDLEKIAKIKKENLWPNGKMAARSLKSLSSTDCQKSNEYERLSKQANEKYQRLSGSSLVKEQRVLKSEEDQQPKEVLTRSAKTGEPDGLSSVDETGAESWRPLPEDPKERQKAINDATPAPTSNEAAKTDLPNTRQITYVDVRRENSNWGVAQPVVDKGNSDAVATAIKEQRDVGEVVASQVEVPAANSSQAISNELPADQTYIELRTCSWYEWYDRSQGLCK
jgi:hypothetical protein